MKTTYALLLSLSAFGLGGIAVSQDDFGPSIKVQEKATIGPWTISKLKTQGKPPYAMMSRTYEDGRMFRYFAGEGVSAIMIFDLEASRALSDSGGSMQGTVWFSGSPHTASGETPPLEVVFSWTNELTTEQDAVVTVDTTEFTDFLAGIAEDESVNLKFGGYTGKFDLSGSMKAADELLKHAFPNAAVSGESPSEKQAEGEVIDLLPTDTSVIWDLSLLGGLSKVYQIPGKAGQKITISYIEDTGMGQIDIGKASVEEGFENGLTIVYDKDRMQRVDVTNPSNQQMDFRIALQIQ